ncbi:transmembrane protein 186 [Epargyreus clarus]|uniref:transmembrane protein 186 n=1 Tax=Epargyreus clarus TaxID=520877 RepID=UPI003C2E58DD
MLFLRFREPALKYMSTVCSRKFCSSKQFETVFSFPSIKYVALLNRLKVYHLFGTCTIIPSCGLMEMANIMPEYTFLTAAYIGLTGAALFAIGSAPFRNVIGFLYISDDNQLIKISSVDFWGKRKDRIVKADDWVPLLDMKPKVMDAIYLSPQLADGTKYKLFVKFGNVLNSTKIGQVLE